MLVWWAGTRPAAGENAAPGTVVADDRGGDALLVATGDGLLEIRSVAWDGGDTTTGAVWARAAGLAPGARFATKATTKN